ncbi:MAG: YhcH/YjgK/YiaL family protein [Lacunisphaera sp.]
MSYETKLPGGLTHETHRDYADVQCLLTGAERMLYTPAERLGPGNGYVAERDYELFDTPDGARRARGATRAVRHFLPRRRPPARRGAPGTPCGAEGGGKGQALTWRAPSEPPRA